MNIGTIELPIINNIETSVQSEVDEIKSELDSVTVKHTPSVQSISIVGFLNSELHSQNLSLENQKNELRKLRSKTKDENSINYQKYKGHLLVDNVKFSDNGESRIVKEFEIEGRYFPWPKYYPESEP
jgi:hypothetical protein